MCIRDSVTGVMMMKEKKTLSLIHILSRHENYDNIRKYMVLVNNGVNIESTDEILEGVECNNGMLVCVDESERMWRESIEVEGLQRVNFPQVYCETRCLQMLLLKGKSPLFWKT